MIPTPVATTPPEPLPRTTVVPAITSTVDPFASAEDKAISAANLAQNASTLEDWDLVKSKLQQAIALMKTVPANSPKRAIAQKRRTLYQQRLKIAQQQSQKLAKGNAPTLTAPKRASPKGEPSKTRDTAAVPALSGGGLTSANYSRVEFGMSPSEVRSLLGAPTTEEGNPSNFSWAWQSSDQKTTIGIGFYENKVAARSCITSSSSMECVSKI